MCGWSNVRKTSSSASSRCLGMVIRTFGEWSWEALAWTMGSVVVKHHPVRKWKSSSKVTNLSKGIQGKGPCHPLGVQQAWFQEFVQKNLCFLYNIIYSKDFRLQKQVNHSFTIMVFESLKARTSTPMFVSRRASNQLTHTSSQRQSHFLRK